MWYLRYLAYQDVFMATSTGIRERSCDLRWSKISNLPFIIPPYDEQIRIVKQIDGIDSIFEPINKLAEINAKKESLYKDYKKALIAELVTGKREVLA